MIGFNRIGIFVQLFFTAVNVASSEFRHDQQIAIGSNAILTCDLSDKLTNQVRWRKIDDDLNDLSRVYNGRLLIPLVKKKDTGVYECFTSDGQFKRVQLIVKTQLDIEQHINEVDIVNENHEKGDSEISDERAEDYPHLTSNDIEDEQHYYCGLEEATCRNGQCIPRIELCNGKKDCEDGTDETNCGGSNASGCEPNERACRNDGKCIQKIWICDGEKDCDDGSDEDCTDQPTNGECRSNEIMCKDQQQCILKSFLCDKEFDCRDHSDEIGCTKPTIVNPLVRNLTITLGETFRIQCKATGWPHPFINWRLNWGHVCEEPRCFSTNYNGCGILTVTDARISDAGAYSCEAINSEGRVFAVPDVILKVDSSKYERETVSQSENIVTCDPEPTKPPAPIELDDSCFCNNHSIDCTCSGYCLNCEHNTIGRSCEFCKPGFSGDATRGTPFDCLPKITTSTTKSSYSPAEIKNYCDCNNHTDECTCSGYCLNCRHNTKGIKCEQCIDGFKGDATRGTPQDCTPEYELDCNPYGTQTKIQGFCTCKSGVTGLLCDKCKPNYYYFLEDKNHKKGCMSCFCNGLSVGCQSSKYLYKPIYSNFEQEYVDWYLSDKFTRLNESVVRREAGIGFMRFDQFRHEELYFIVPGKFKGNKILSYGGYINFIFKFTSASNESSNQNIELRISGSNINIFHVYNRSIKPNVNNNITIHLLEDQFKRYGDNGKIKKEFMLLALSNIDLIMIKAKISQEQESVVLKDFSLDYGEEAKGIDGSIDNSSKAGKKIEICDCPKGYAGTSCETCAKGFKRSKSGFYWGLCEKDI